MCLPKCVIHVTVQSIGTVVAPAHEFPYDRDAEELFGTPSTKTDGTLSYDNKVREVRRGHEVPKVHEDRFS